MMTSRFIKVQHMRLSEREGGVYYDSGKIIINLDHITSIKGHQSLTGFYVIEMLGGIEYIVDHSLLEHFPIMGSDYLEGAF